MYKRQVACSAQTYRANEIETYDTAFFRYALQGGGEALFIATHAAENERTVNPRFVYEFCLLYTSRCV